MVGAGIGAKPRSLTKCPDNKKRLGRQDGLPAWSTSCSGRRCHWRIQKAPLDTVLEVGKRAGEIKGCNLQLQDTVFQGPGLYMTKQC